MDEYQINYRDLINSMPLKIRFRMQSLRAYVESVLNELQARKHIAAAHRLKQEDKEAVQIGALVFSLKWLFVNSIKARERTLQVFNQIGCKSYSIGSMTISSSDDEPYVASQLFQKLEETMQKYELWEIINDHTSLRKLIEHLFERASENNV